MVGDVLVHAVREIICIGQALLLKSIRADSFVLSKVRAATGSGRLRRIALSGGAFPHAMLPMHFQGEGPEGDKWLPAKELED